MERPDRPIEGSAPNTRRFGNSYLLARLRDPEPEVRARFAEAAGIVRASGAIPYLRDAVVSDSDARVRDAAQTALDVLLQPSQAAAGESGVRPSGATAAAALRHESEAVIALFNDYVAHRMTAPYKPGQADLIGPVAVFLGAWGSCPAEDLDEIERTAVEAVRSIAGFLGVPNSSAGVKSLSFQGAMKRVANYEALIAACDEPEEE